MGYFRIFLATTITAACCALALATGWEPAPDALHERDRRREWFAPPDPLACRAVPEQDNVTMACGEQSLIGSQK